VGEQKRIRVGLVGIALIIVGVFAILTFILYALQNILGISIPYPSVTITLTWALIALVGVWILGHAIQTTLSQLTRPTSAVTARKIVTVTFVFVIVVATLTRLGIDLTAYLVSLGVTAVVIGFAAQTTIGNLIAGVLVLVSKPFRKGDYIRVNITGGPIEGTVDEISFLRSRVLTNDGVSISVPNTVMLATPISNFTVFERRPIILNISLGKRVSVEKFRKRIESSLAGQETKLYVKGFNRDSLEVELWVNVATQNFLKERSQIVHYIQEICRRGNISLQKIELQG
jgi:small-conductance mechanosensitive channel